MSETAFDFKKENKVTPKDMPKLIQTMTNEHEDELGHLRKQRRNRLEQKPEKSPKLHQRQKECKNSNILKAPSKKGMMFR